MWIEKEKHCFLHNFHVNCLYAEGRYVQVFLLSFLFFLNKTYACCYQGAVNKREVWSCLGEFLECWNFNMCCTLQAFSSCLSLRMGVGFCCSETMLLWWVWVNRCVNFEWYNHTELVLTAGKVSHVGGCVGQCVAHRVNRQHSWSILFSLILLDITAVETHWYKDYVSACNYVVYYSVHVELEDFLFPLGYVWY